MNNHIDTIRKERLFLLQLVEDVTVDQLNEVPPGFANNIIWNLAHMVAAQQGVCYLRANVKTRIDETFYQRFKPGTKPEGYIDEHEVAAIKTLLISTLDPFDADYQDGVFVNYTAWTTRYGVELNNVDEVLQFLFYHDGLHTGYIMALKRAVKNMENKKPQA